jgi:hypothetical protein
MSYQIVRTTQYRARPELGFLNPFLNSGFINFATDIRPYYPDITEEMYFAEISAISSVWGNLDSIAQFFNNTDGLASYDYSFIDPNNRFNGVIQTIVYRDKDAYDQWQNNENNRAKNATNKLSMNLSEDGGFDASTFVLDGIVRTNTATGITKELTLDQFLTTKFNMLRNTLCTIVHSTIE